MPDGVTGYIIGSWSVDLGSNPNLALIFNNMNLFVLLFI